MNITFYNNRFNNYNNTASYKNFNPEFRGKSREVEKIVKDCMANPELKEKNSALLIEKILKALPDIMQATRAIGEGTRNRVQRATNEIALRIPLDFKLTKENLEIMKNINEIKNKKKCMLKFKKSREKTKKVKQKHLTKLTK